MRLTRGQRLGWLFAVAVLTAVIGVGALVDPAARSSGDTVTAAPSLAQGRPAPDDGVSADDLSALTELLQRRGAALTDRDQAAFLADLDPTRTDFVAAQTALFDQMGGVAFTSVSYALSPGDQLPTTDQRFAAYGGEVVAFRVSLSLQLADVEVTPDVHLQSFTFTRAGPAAAWRLASDADFDGTATPTWRGMWDFGPLVTFRSEHALLVSHAQYADRLPGLADEVESAVASVNDVWGTDWAERAVVLVPDTAAELLAVGNVTIPIDQLAAVATATSVDFLNGRASGQRVLLNPDRLDELGPRSAQAVLTHEVTHLATRAVTRPGTPLWLVEGFADYVGLGAVGAGPGEAASSLAAQLASGQRPTALPADSAFTAETGTVDAVYAQAWLACRYLASQLGPQGLVDFYRAVADAPDPAVALTQQLGAQLGLSDDAFVQAWLDYLQVTVG